MRRAVTALAVCLLAAIITTRASAIGPCTEDGGCPDRHVCGPVYFSIGAAPFTDGSEIVYTRTYCAFTDETISEQFDVYCYSPGTPCAAKSALDTAGISYTVYYSFQCP